jgi:hypothetical protein
VDGGRLTGAGKLGIRVGKVIGRHKMAKHYTLTITDTAFAFTRNTDAITAEAALDGIYVIPHHHRPRADAPRPPPAQLHKSPGPSPNAAFFAIDSLSSTEEAQVQSASLAAVR